MKKLTLSAQTAVNLSIAINEMDIGYQYREFISRKIQGLTFSSPYNCDGYGVHSKLLIRLLCEFKKNVDLSNRYDLCTVLAQAIHYIKNFEMDGLPLPTTILLADRDEFAVLHTNDVVNYLSMTFDWTIAPSSVEKDNKELIKLLFEDNRINPFVFDINQLDDVVDKIKNLSKEVKSLSPITTNNISKVFEYFTNKVLTKNKFTTNELANLFVQILVNPVDNFLHPLERISSIVTKSFGIVPVKSRKVYKSFFEHFKSDYTPKEKSTLTSILDRLIYDKIRRKEGAFFTSTPWADKAHQYNSKIFGENWKDEFVVWDPAWGTGNLTRDYRFKELYVSTLNQSDIDTANQMGYNPEAVKFQFDFLNDSSDRLPKGLKLAIEKNKKILILMNPPYVKSTPNKGNDTTGVSDTEIGKKMNKNDMGIASSQLSSQFIYRIMDLKKINPNIYITMFNKPNFMTSDGFKNLRISFLENFGYEAGFIFNSAHFSDTSNSWGVSYSIWSNEPNEIKHEFKHTIIENEDSFNLIEKGETTLYNCDNRRKANYFFNQKEKNDIPLPPIKSFLTIDTEKKKNGSSRAIGYMNNDSNNLMQQNVIFLASSVISANGNKAITPDNFYQAVSLFAARKIVTQNWINDKNEYLAPDVENENYLQFCFDSVVYSLFNNSSQQSSLRNIDYDDKHWNIKNEFFWMSNHDISNISNEKNYSNLFNDARTDSDRYLNKIIFGENGIYEKLSSDAKLVLDRATELVKKSMEIREMFANEENHLDSWDAGYAQLKLLWKQHYPEEFKDFRELYKKLEDRMRPLVYELGFLIK